eukprot:jgi/Mesvir1/4652/Mv03467-RA.1
MVYVSAQGLAGLDRYKYSSIDNSPLSKYVMHPFWDAVVRLLPRTLSPNMMTLLGFLLSLSIPLLLAWFDPFMECKEVPPWVWLFSAAAHFAAHTLDGCDGKQARRTGSSTPLGELIDHGMDSMAVTLQTVSMCALLCTTPFQLALAVCAAQSGFYIVHWEKYLTGVLFLPWAYDASQLLETIVYLVTAARGRSIWHSPLFQFPGITLGGVAVPPMSLNGVDLFFIGTLFFAALQQLASPFNVICSGKMRGKGLTGWLSGLLPLIPIISLQSLMALWVLKSGSSQPGASITATSTLGRSPWIAVACAGLIFSNMTSRLVVSAMTSQRHRVTENWLVFALALAVLAAVTGTVPPHQQASLLLAPLTAVALAAHIHYWVGVTSDICKHLNIYCFIITRRPRQESKKTH